MTFNDIDFNVGSGVKVIDGNHFLYRARGKVVEMPEYDREKHVFLSNACRCDLVDLKGDVHKDVEMRFSAIANIQKKFIDIEHIRETSINLGDNVIRKGNTDGFDIGDMIQISEKIDGANASVSWNPDEGKLEVFSRTNLLDGADSLRGFKQYIEAKFRPDAFSSCPDYVVFGEWCVGHKCRYDASWYNVWRVYDIWDKTRRNYLPQSAVREFCRTYGIEYIHVLYEGPFQSWEHCRSFLHSNTYGESQEGIVVKNQTKLGRSDVIYPKYLKIVNDAFRESMVKKRKNADSAFVKAYNEGLSRMKSVATKARVEKIVMKLVDEGVIGPELKPDDMGMCCRLVPKLVYEDLLKEESEIMAAVENAGKLCSKVVVEHIREIVMGK